MFCHVPFDDSYFFIICTWSYELPYYGKTLALPRDDLLHFQIEGFGIYSAQGKTVCAFEINLCAFSAL